MASAAAAIDQAATPKNLDASLWWDSFVVLFDELGNVPLASPFPESLLKKIQDNHWWFINIVSGFKDPNTMSRLALDSPGISIGEHQLSVNADLKEVALTVSLILNLDEVQAYILLHRCNELQNPMISFRDSYSLHWILVQYYLERQCILKCIRRIFTHALYVGKGSCEVDIVSDLALRLVKEGLEDNLLQFLDRAKSTSHSEKTDVDVVTLWVEECLLEHNLVLDILFLVYYDNYCICSPQKWKKLCVIFVEILSGTLYFGKLAVSIEARSYFYYMKVQLLLVLIKCLNLEDLLRKVCNEGSFRDGCSVFSVADVQNIDALISKLIPLEANEGGPLVLSWAVFLCLLQSLPDCQGHNTLSEIDHVGYVQEAMLVAPFNYLVEVLHCDLLKDSEGPVTAYLSVLRTFVSSFISAYEIKYQLEDVTLSLILEVLFQIYRGEETLCMQFWDRESFVDGPIRSLLRMLENEFPFHLVEFIRMLSSLCEGAWPAECVYNFLDNLSGVTFSYVIPNILNGVSAYEIIETPHVLHIPGLDGVVIPSNTNGQVIKMIDEKTVLVRWQHAQSGVFQLLVRLTQEFYSINYDELDTILDLLYRLIYFNKVLCFTLLENSSSLDVKLVNGHTETSRRIDIVKALSMLVCNLFNDTSNTRLVTMCFNILGEMIKCLPSHVCERTQKTNLFGFCDFDSSSDTWFLSKRLAGMLLVDCEKNEGCILTISVLDYVIRLIEVGDESSLVPSLVVFSVQYVLVNHEHWKYKLKSDRWKVTLKVFDVMKRSIDVMEGSSKHELIVKDILFNDSSVQHVIFRIVCITSRNLESMYVSRLYETKEIDGLQLAIASALDIILYMLKETLKMENTNSDVPMLVQKMLFSNVKSVPAFAASLISFFHDSGIQLSATRVLSLSFEVASRVQTPSLVGNDAQFGDLVTSIITILDGGDIHENEDLIVSVVDLLVAAAHNQPLVFANIISFGMNVEEHPNNKVDQSNQFGLIYSPGSLGSKRNIIGSILCYVNRSTSLFKSAPRLLLCILNFLKGLWEAGAQYTQILDIFRRSESFWNHLSALIPLTETTNSDAEKLDSNVDSLCFAGYRYQCHAAIFEIMAHDIFFLGNISHMLSEKQTSKNCNISTPRSSSVVSKGASDVFITWCEGSVVASLVKLYSSIEYDIKIVYHAKMALSLCLVHLMEKISTGDTGSLSLALVRKIHTISNKLSSQPAFSTLSAQYTYRGYSKIGEHNGLILRDLYHHLLGELEGREISHGSFKELVLYLLNLDVFQRKSCKYKNKIDTCLPKSDFYMFDLPCLRTELSIDLWDYSNWKLSKPIFVWALDKMHEANSVTLISNSKCLALKAITTALAVHERNNAGRMSDNIGKGIPDTILQSSIKHVCTCLQDAEDSINFFIHTSIPSLNFYDAQIELLNYLCQSLLQHDVVESNSRRFLPTFILLIKTASSALGFFCLFSPSATLQRNAINLFLLLILASVEYIYSAGKTKAVDLIAEGSLITLGLLPILCRYAEFSDYLNLSIASIDLILKGFLSPITWLPVLQKHLKLQNIINKLQLKDSGSSIIVILKFLLTLAQSKGGAEMLQALNCFSSLKGVLTVISYDDNCELYMKPNTDDCREQIWGLGLAIVTSIIYSLGDDSSSSEFVDSVISYFLHEKDFMIHRCLSPPNIPCGDLSMKKRKTQKLQISLTSLKEAEHTVMLICEIAKHRTSWTTSMKGKESGLRETCIHMLAFVGKGVQNVGEAMNRNGFLLCPPVSRIEVEANERPPFIGSKTGWFSLSAKKKAASISSVTSLPNRDSNTHCDSFCQSMFSDMVALHIYKITFLILKFLCMQAASAARRAEDVQSVDLALFPELPTTEILHGLQDQTVTIIIELCKANQHKPFNPDIQSVCLLLMQILEKSLYLELFVSQSCGIRPLLGRAADFSNKITSLVEVTSLHRCFNAMLKSLNQILDLLYPELLQLPAIL